MRLSAAIMAHPAREQHVDELWKALGDDIPIVWDDQPGPPSSEPVRRWRTGVRAWQAHDPAADYHMVIQDDALVCDDLLIGLEVALDEIGPDGLVSPYLGTGRPDQANVAKAIASAHRRGHSWCTTWSLCWGVAIIAPVRTIDDMLEWCSAPRRAAMNYDMRLGRYYRDVLRWRTWYTHPSLVDHRDDESLIGHGGERRAHHMHHGSALEIPWSAHDGLNPYFEE